MTGVQTSPGVAEGPRARLRRLRLAAGVATLVDGDSFAYRTVRPTSEERTAFEFGVYGHGPNAKELAEHLTEQIQTWDRDHRTDRALITAHPADTPDHQLPAGRVIDKWHMRAAISWPRQRTHATGTRTTTHNHPHPTGRNTPWQRHSRTVRRLLGLRPDITVVAQGPIIPDLMNDTSGNRTSTCQSACSNSTCVSG